MVEPKEMSYEHLLILEVKDGRLRHAKSFENVSHYEPIMRSS